MDQEQRTRLDALETKIEAMHTSVDKIRRYFQITLWGTAILFVAPLILLMFVAPAVMNSYLGSLGSNTGNIDLVNIQGDLKQLQDLQNDKGW